MLAHHLKNTKKEYKSLKKHKIRDIYINEVAKACFQHDMAYADFEDLTNR